MFNNKYEGKNVAYSGALTRVYNVPQGIILTCSFLSMCVCVVFVCLCVCAVEHRFIYAHNAAQ